VRGGWCAPRAGAFDEEDDDAPKQVAAGLKSPNGARPASPGDCRGVPANDVDKHWISLCSAYSSTELHSAESSKLVSMTSSSPWQPASVGGGRGGVCLLELEASAGARVVKMATGLQTPSTRGVASSSNGDRGEGRAWQRSCGSRGVALVSWHACDEPPKSRGSSSLSSRGVPPREVVRGVPIGVVWMGVPTGVLRGEQSMRSSPKLRRGPPRVLQGGGGMPGGAVQHGLKTSLMFARRLSARDLRTTRESEADSRPPLSDSSSGWNSPRPHVPEGSGPRDGGGSSSGGSDG